MFHGSLHHSFHPFTPVFALHTKPGSVREPVPRKEDPLAQDLLHSGDWEAVVCHMRGLPSLVGAGPALQHLHAQPVDRVDVACGLHSEAEYCSEQKHILQA